MKKRNMALAIGAVSLGLAVSYTFAMLRIAHKTLAAIMEPLSKVVESEQKRMVRHFGLLALPNSLDTFREVANDLCGRHQLRGELQPKEVARIAACDLVGAKTGLVGPMIQGTVEPLTENKTEDGSSVFDHFSYRVKVAIRTACPSSYSLARLASFKERVGLVPAGCNQSVPTPFEAQQTYLCRAMAGLHAPNDWQLRYVVKKFVRAALK